jgi:uncharacterized DUF497 family protein
MFEWDEALDTVHFENGEWRVSATGPWDKDAVAVITYVEYENMIRLINLRLATRVEVKRYVAEKTKA